MKTKVDPFDYPEKYRLPIVIYESDIQQERAYLQFYNEEYMRKYKKLIDSGRWDETQCGGKLT